MSGRITALLATTALAAAPLARAAEPCTPGAALPVDGLGTPADELSRLAELAPGVLVPESGLLRRGARSTRLVCEGSPGTPWDARFVVPIAPGDGVAIVPPRIVATFRNLSPGGGDDGVLWQGRGLSTLTSGGVAVRRGILSVQLAPAVTWSQNQAFPIVPTGEPGDLGWRNAWYGEGLDLPQRFGATAFSRVSLGQSHVQLEAFQLQLGVSTENRWLGPGIRSSLLLSNNAEGFPHAFLGTARPLDIGIGKLELLLLWGRLSRSAYFPDGGHPAIAMLALAYEPRWVPGLHLGAGRSYVESWSALRGDLYLSALEPPIKGWLPGGDNPEDNQFLSLWARWVHPASGLEVYGEWALEDFAAPDKIVRQPERTSAWTIVLQKLFVAGPRWIRVIAEATTTRDTLPAGYGSRFYTHRHDLGYTNGGQYLGAWIGTGADAQHLGVDVFTPRGRFGGYVERVRRNDDVFWQEIAVAPPDSGHDAELVAALRQVIFAGGLELSWEAGAGYRWNRDFLRNEPVLRASIGVAARR
jgi:hypothetical protein